MRCHQRVYFIYIYEREVLIVFELHSRADAEAAKREINVTFLSLVRAALSEMNNLVALCKPDLRAFINIMYIYIYNMRLLHAVDALMYLCVCLYLAPRFVACGKLRLLNAHTQTFKQETKYACLIQLYLSTSS